MFAVWEMLDVLEAVLGPALDDGDTRLVRGVPDMLEPSEHASVYLLGFDNGRRTVQNRALVEEYRLNVLVEVHGLATRDAVDGRLKAIWNTIDDVVSGDPGLPAPFDAIAEMRSGESGWVNDQHWLARGVGSVQAGTVVPDG